MRHRMASDFEAKRTHLAHLINAEITGCAEETSGEIESGAHAEFLKHWSGSDQISLATVVELNAHARLGWVKQGVAHAQASKPRILEPLHLFANPVERQNIPHVAGLGLDQLPTRDFEFVVHQEDDARERHWIVRKSRAAARLQRALSSPTGCACRSSI